MRTFWFVFNGELHVINLDQVRQVVFLAHSPIQGAAVAVDVYHANGTKAQILLSEEKANDLKTLLNAPLKTPTS